MVKQVECGLLAGDPRVRGPRTWLGRSSIASAGRTEPLRGFAGSRPMRPDVITNHAACDECSPVALQQPMLRCVEDEGRSKLVR
jgi:hypothetical protein